MTDIEVKVTELLGLADEAEAWRKRKADEHEAMEQRVVTVSGKVRTEFELWLDDEKKKKLEEYRARIRAAAKRMNDANRVTSKDQWNREMRMIDDVSKVLLPAFSNPVCSVSKVIYDPASNADKPRGLLRWGWQTPAPIIVAGKFGIGLRENVNAKQISSMDEMRYILANVIPVAKALRANKHEEMAKMLEAINECVPNIGCFSLEHYGGSMVSVPLVTQVEVIDSAKMPNAFTAHLLEMSESEVNVVGVRLGKSRSARDIVTRMSSTALPGEKGLPVYGDEHAVNAQVNCKRIWEQLPEAIECMEKMVAQFEEAMKRDVVEELRNKLGRWLLISSI